MLFPVVVNRVWSLHGKDYLSVAHGGFERIVSLCSDTQLTGSAGGDFTADAPNVDYLIVYTNILIGTCGCPRDML